MLDLMENLFTVQALAQQTVDAGTLLGYQFMMEMMIIMKMNCIILIAIIMMTKTMMMTSIPVIPLIQDQARSLEWVQMTWNIIDEEVDIIDEQPEENDSVQEGPIAEDENKDMDIIDEPEENESVQ